MSRDACHADERANLRNTMINVASIISDDSEMSGSTSVAPLHTLTPSRRERFENSELFKIALLRSHISGRSS